MGQLAVPLVIASTVMGFAESKRAGNVAKTDARMRNREERLAGRDAQIQRNEELINELARRRVLHASGGGAGGGSFASLQKRSAELADMDQNAIKVMSQNRIRSTRRQADNAKRQSNFNAFGSIAKGATQVSLLS